MVFPRLLLFFIVLLPLAGFSQGYINLSKKQVRRALTKQVSANDTINILLTETDTSLHYSVRDIKMSAADFIYLFDKKNKCNAEIVIAGCDSCFTKYLQKAVTQQNTGWKKLKENMYISKFSKKMLLEIPANNTPHSFIIRRMKWDKQIYQTLLTSK